MKTGVLKIFIMYSFAELVVEPIYQIVRNHKGSVEELFGNSEIFRNMFEGCYEKDRECPRLEDLSEPDKNFIWKDSLMYSPKNRLGWCKAIIYYKSLNKKNEPIYTFFS